MKRGTLKELMENKEFRKQVFKEINSSEKYLVEYTSSLSGNSNSSISSVLHLSSLYSLASPLDSGKVINEDAEILKNLVQSMRHYGGKDTVNCVLTYNEVLQNGHLKSYTLKHTCGKRESKVQ
jgi:hypothetical protein